MRILHRPSELAAGSRKVCLAIGVFDGVHLGHQQVLRKSISDARHHEAAAVVVTFDRHPNAIVAPERTPPLVYSLAQKLRVIASLEPDAALLIAFDKPFSELSGETFIRNLARDFGQIHSVCVGATFTFGYKRSGNVALLKALGQELKFVVHGLAAVSLDGKIVSSTRIREAIRAGNLEAASQMLGRTYALAGAVVHGDHLGRQLGFPTANLDITGLAIPPHGVYAVQARLENRIQRAVVNIGHRPTLQEPAPPLRVEVHLLDFAGDLYGQEMEITFVEKLREEERFPNRAALQAQLARDVQAARDLFN
ncbi:MAG: bifunctional riboflavin kinase/FAD synthetase [Verrucomicrobiota bacterium]